MKREKETKKDLSRRDFIKTTAVGVGATTLAGLGASKAAASEGGVPTVWDYESEVVVVGAGGAGLCAAIEAHDHGANVLVVEKQPEKTHYSNSRMSGGAYHSPDPASDRNALEQYLLAMFSGENLPWKIEGEQPHVSEGIVELFADYIVENVQWLKSIDPDYSPTFTTGTSFPTFPGAQELSKTYRTYSSRYPQGQTNPNIPPYEQPRMNKMSGEAFHECLMTGIKNRGIPILYSTRAKGLVKSDGQIIGVLATRDSREIAVKAKRAVVLTAGGYEYNVAQRRAFLKGPGVRGWVFYGSPDNTGDGISMAIEVGAGLAKVGKAASRIEIGIPYGRGYEETGLKMGMISFGQEQPNSFIVDNHGKRYWNEPQIVDATQPYRYQFYEEALKYDMKAMDYPRVPSWLVFDETMRARQPLTRFDISTAGFRFIPWTPDNMDAINRGWILKAETIEELAAKIKADPENRTLMNAGTLVETATNFNSYAASGVDLEFGRVARTMGPVEKPPYYACKFYPGGPNTKGSIDADGQRHVLDWEGKPIPRLYTAGEMSSTFKFVYQGGGNITECIVCGRIAGKNAAAEAPWYSKG
ncbi:MAG: FAD-dependent oxidoreductase [Acidobacteria bacterium]|nr:FAD-dependent oxidoreductase [Acidobacteriota bacterium]